MEIVFPKLTSYQQEVWEWLGDCKNSGKIAVIKSVRQSGKSFFCLLKLIEQSLSHIGVSVMFEPTLAQARNMFKQLTKFLEGSNIIKIANSQLLEIEFINGSSILFKSTEQSNRGFTVSNLLILDECAYLDNEEIYAILPLVNANNAPMIIVSTPFTREGYFYDMYLKGLEGQNRIKTFDWSNQKELERFLSEEQKNLYKQTMNRFKYQTEVLGEFLTNDGLLFTNLENCIGKTSIEKSSFGYIGIDFASGNDGDFTVISCMNENGEQILIKRVNNLSPMQQVEWLIDILIDISQNLTIRKILAEKNSIGAVYIDAMNKKLPKDIKITEWTTSNSSKQDLVTTLQIALENNQVTLLNDENLLNELRKYEAEIKPNSNVIRYNGKNCHDDMVMATMLSYYAYKKSFGTYSFSF